MKNTTVDTEANSGSDSNNIVSDEESSRQSSSKDDFSNTSPSSEPSTSASTREGSNFFHTTKDDLKISGAKCIFLTLLMATAAGLAT